MKHRLSGETAAGDIGSSSSARLRALLIHPRGTFHPTTHKTTTTTTTATTTTRVLTHTHFVYFSFFLTHFVYVHGVDSVLVVWSFYPTNRARSPDQQNTVEPVVVGRSRGLGPKGGAIRGGGANGWGTMGLRRWREEHHGSRVLTAGIYCAPQVLSGNIFSFAYTYIYRAPYLTTCSSTQITGSAEYA